MFQYITNIPIWGCAIIDIADIFTFNNIAYAVYCNISQCSTVGLRGQSKYASPNNRNQQILTKKTQDFTIISCIVHVLDDAVLHLL